MQETLHGHHTTTYLRWWEIHTQLRFADDIDLIRGSNGELQDLTKRLIERATAYGMDVSTKKSKIMINITNNASADISTNGQKSQEVTSFKHLGATL